MPSNWMPGALRRLFAGKHFRAAARERRAGAWAKAIEHDKRGLAWDDRTPGRWVDHAESLRALGRVAKSIEALERAEALAPANAEVRYQLGLAKRLMGDFEGALEHFAAAAALDPGHAGAAEAQEALAPLARKFARLKASGLKKSAGPDAGSRSGAA